MTLPEAGPPDVANALGFTEWESRAYLALLRQSPMSGYAVAKHSGVPRSKVYEVLASLANKAAVHVSNADTPLYAPVVPAELVQRVRDQTNAGLDAAEATMSRYATQVATTSGAIWDIQGREAIIARARQLVRDAKRRLMAEVWSLDAIELRDDLEAATDRGVEVIVVAYGDVDYPFAHVYPHPLTDEVTTGLGGRWLVLSKDTSEVVAGNVSGGTGSRAAWTSHPGLVIPITELIAHDIYKLEMLAALGPELEAQFGPGLQKLRERFGSADQPHSLAAVTSILGTPR